MLLKSWCHGEMDWVQQLNFYYLDPVAIRGRFIGQLKSAGKTYMKFERQESNRESGSLRDQAFCFRKSSS